MIKIGKNNRLNVVRVLADTVCVGETSEDEPIPLSHIDSQQTYQIGDELEVFVFNTREGGLQATLAQPLAQVGEVAWLKVISLSRAGAFLDWGLSKDLLLPFSEQTGKVTEGRYCLVKLFLDEENRVTASMALDDFIQDEAFYLTEGQKVDLIIADETDLGLKAVINHEFWGVLYWNELFQPLKKGQKVKGQVKKVRSDHKIDLILEQTHYNDRIEMTIEKILQQLAEHQGYLPVGDKTSPDIIYKQFGVSKKIFKQALGGLYKQHKIVIGANRIEWVETNE